MRVLGKDLVRCVACSEEFESEVWDEGGGLTTVRILCDGCCERVKAGEVFLFPCKRSEAR